MARNRHSGGVGGKVRPTTSKILESLSAILRPRLEGSKVLDLFAGTGRVGLRLLEEGAAQVLFVEGHRKVAGELREALKRHPRGADAALLVGAIPQALRKIEGSFDVAVCDPPYDWAHPATLLPGVASLVEPGGLLVVEHHHKTQYVEDEGWVLARTEKFGESRLSFFERLAVHPVDEP